MGGVGGGKSDTSRNGEKQTLKKITKKKSATSKGLARLMV